MVFTPDEIETLSDERLEKEIKLYKPLSVDPEIDFEMQVYYQAYVLNLQSEYNSRPNHYVRGKED